MYLILGYQPREVQFAIVEQNPTLLNIKSMFLAILFFQLSCSLDLTTNSETTNHEFSQTLH